MNVMRAAALLVAILFAALFVGEASAGEPGDAAYLALLAQAKQAPGEVDYAALRNAYAASSYYHQRLSDPDGLVRAGAEVPPDRVMQFSDDNFPIVESQVLAMNQLAPGSDAFNLHLQIVRGLVKAMLATGDGRSAATAYRVLATSEEYGILAQVAKMNIVSQSVSTVGDRAYDLFRGTDQQGRAVEVWFDISEFFWVGHDRSGDGLYLSLVAQARLAPDSVDYAVFRKAYAASSYYRKGESDPNNLLAAGVLDPAKAPTPDEVRAFVDANFPVFSAQLMALSPAVSPKGSPDYDLHLSVVRGLLGAITSGADGKGAATAFPVLVVSEEYSIMSALKLATPSQRLVTAGGRKYDVLTGTDDAGKKVDVWFDISAFFP